MKRIFFLAVGALSLTLVAFVEPGKEAKPKAASGVTRTGEHSFKVDGTTRFTDEEQLTFDRQDKELYNISNVRLSCNSSIGMGHIEQEGRWFAFKEIKDKDHRRQIWIAGDAIAVQNNPVLQEVEKVLEAYAN
jgi:hypothetical protein